MAKIHGKMPYFPYSFHKREDKVVVEIDYFYALNRKVISLVNIFITIFWSSK